MALGKGIPVINGFDLNSKLPLDSRTVADTKEEMNALVTNGSVGDGQLCYCKADKKLYVLKEGVWSEVGGEGGGGNDLYFDLSPYTETFQLDTEGLEKFTNAITKGKIIGVALISNGLFFDYKGIYNPGSSNYSYYFSNNNEGILISQEGAISPHLPIYMPFLPEDASTKNYTLNSVNGTLTWNTIGNGLEIKDGALQATGGGGGKSVPPALNLSNFETGEVRTTITEEEYNNLKNRLYNSVNYYTETPEEVYLQSKLFSTYDDKNKSLSCNFSSIKINFTSETDMSLTNVVYQLNIGQKDTSGNYPITIEKIIEIPFGSNSGGSGASLNVVTIDNFSKGDHNQQGFVMPTENVVLFTDNALVSMTGYKNVQNGVISYTCLHYMVSVQDGHYKYAGTLYEITAITGGYHIEKTEMGISPEFLPNYSGSDNGKVLSVVNGKTQWTTPADSLTFPTTSPSSQLIPSITTSNKQQNLTIGNGLEIKDGALQATGGGGGSGSNVETFQPTITNVSVSTLDEKKEISISFDALNGVKPYIQSLVDGDKNFSANLFLRTIVHNDYQIRLISPLSLINVRSGDTIFVMGGRLIQDSTSKIDFRLTFYTTGPTLTFYFDNNDTYTQFKQLASLLFTTDTILKLTIKTDE